MKEEFIKKKGSKIENTSHNDEEKIIVDGENDSKEMGESKETVLEKRRERKSPACSRNQTMDLSIHCLMCYPLSYHHSLVVVVFPLVGLKVS